MVAGDTKMFETVVWTLQSEMTTAAVDTAVFCPGIHRRLAYLGQANWVSPHLEPSQLSKNLKEDVI
jgi:hypothetical protein